MNKSEHPTCPAGFKTSIGGQAIIEGVMMKGPKKTAMSVRKQDGTLYHEVWDNPEKKWYHKVPFVRGITNFISSMLDGYKCLMKSAEIATDGIEMKIRQSLTSGWKKSLATNWLKRSDMFR